MRYRKKILSKIFIFVILYLFAFSSLFLNCSISNATTTTTDDETSVSDLEADEEDTDEDSTEYKITTEYPDEPGREPDLVSESAIVIDASTGNILYQKNAFEQNYPASITKIMTCLLALENSEMDETITMSYDAVWGIERDSNNIALNVDEEISMKDALYALMLESANEVAWGIGEHVAGGSISDFADMMNEKASELGCLNTHFTNSNGLPDDDHYTTCYDMALITKACLQYDDFREITNTISYTIGPTNLCEEERPLWHHCRMLYSSSKYYYEYCEGGKTGYTTAAKNTLVTWSKKGDTELICVVMNCNGASNAYTDSKALYNYCFENYSTITPLSDYTFDETEAADALSYLNDYYGLSRISDITLSIDTGYKLNFNTNASADDLEYSIEYYDNPVSEDDIITVGRLVISYDDEMLGFTDIYVSGYSLEEETQTQTEAITEEEVIEATVTDTTAFDMKNLLQILLIAIPIVLILGFIIYVFHVSRTRKKQQERAAARRQEYEKHKQLIEETYDIELDL